MSASDLLQRAIAALPVREVLRKEGLGEGLPDRDGVKFCSPFRPDERPGCTLAQGKFHDWSRDEHLDSYDVFQRAKGLDSKQAFRPFVEMAGLGHELNGDTQQPVHRQRRRDGNFNWQECVDRVTEDHLTEFAKWRGYSPEFCQWLVDQKLIGRVGEDWALPVQHNGEVVAAHVRRGKDVWHFWPKLSELGVPLTPLVVGDLENAKTILAAESQWDIFAALDRLGIRHGEEIAGIATRGASNGRLVKPASGALYLLPQNDEPGERWRQCAQESLGQTAKIIQVPAAYHDTNDWLQVADGAQELVKAMSQTETASTPADEDPFDRSQGSDQEALEQGVVSELVSDISRAICSSRDLVTIEIPKRPFLVGEWFQEADLGFVYAQRGVGKSFFAMDLGHALAEKRPFGPWPVHTTAKVLYLDGEMPPDAIKERDAKLGNPTENLEYVNHGLLYDRSGRVMNLADPLLQQALLELCRARQTNVLILDNLSTLVSGADENKGTDWELLQPWLLQLRRARISVVFVHHSGRDPKSMRGHTKREDPAFWIIRLDQVEDMDASPGARFIARFTKWRNIAQVPPPHEWHYRPDGERITLTVKLAGHMELFLHEVENGNGSATGIAEALDLSKGYVAKLAKKAEDQGLITVTGGRGPGRGQYSLA